MRRRHASRPVPPSRVRRRAQWASCANASLKNGSLSGSSGAAAADSGRRGTPRRRSGRPAARCPSSESGNRAGRNIGSTSQIRSTTRMNRMKTATLASSCGRRLRSRDSSSVNGSAKWPSDERDRDVAPAAAERVHVERNLFRQVAGPDDQALREARSTPTASRTRAAACRDRGNGRGLRYVASGSTLQQREHDDGQRERRRGPGRRRGAARRSSSTSAGRAT